MAGHDFHSALELQEKYETEKLALASFIRNSDFIPEPADSNYKWPKWLAELVMTPNPNNGERLRLFVFLYRNGVGSTELIRDIMLWWVRRMPQMVTDPANIERHVNAMMNSINFPDKSAYNRKQKDEFDTMTVWSLVQRKALDYKEELAQQRQRVDLPKDYKFSEDLELLNAYEAIMNSDTDGTYGPDYWMIKAYDKILHDINEKKLEAIAEARKAKPAKKRQNVPEATATPDTVADEEERLVVTLPLSEVKPEHQGKKLRRFAVDPNDGRRKINRFEFDKDNKRMKRQEESEEEED